MGHMSYEESKSKVLRIILVLGFITICEVIFALLGKGYIVEGLHFPEVIMAGVMIIMSLVKAYLIVYEFMHMKYEVPGLVKTVVLPTLLLVWAIIAFFYEGNGWRKDRANLQEKYRQSVDDVPSNSTGKLDSETYRLY
jgi:cytochrome c oxidase subunit IV